MKTLSKNELRALAHIACEQHAITKIATNKRAYTEHELRERATLTRDERKAFDAMKATKATNEQRI